MPRLDEERAIPPEPEEPRGWRRTVRALLADGATILDAIEGAILVARANRRGGEEPPASAADGLPPSGVREVSAPPPEAEERTRAAG